jgi:Cd(II)/Pb(II)-responsive transcriptional regulator
MRIGQLARRADCDVETIRFYEREGLLPKPDREPNGYRQYGSPHLKQLHFIRHCRTLDIGLADIRTLLEFRSAPRLPCGAVNLLIDRHIARVHERIQALRVLEAQLLGLRRTCGLDVPTASCGIINNLQREDACDSLNNR